LNQELAGTISRGEEKVMEVSPGVHTIRIEIDWVVSKEHEFEVKSGETAIFEATGTLKEMAILEPAEQPFIQNLEKAVKR
jgi:hypothetical protein